MRARIDGRVMVLGRRAAAAHEVAPACTRGEWGTARTTAEARPETALDPHSALLPRRRVGMGGSRRSNDSAAPSTWTPSSFRGPRRRSRQAVRTRSANASR